MSGEGTPTPVRPRPWKRLLQNLGLSLATFLFCVAAFEALLRLLGYGNLEIYQPDPQLYWTLKPNQNCYTKVDHKPVHVNSHGTRGPEFQTEKPPNTIRIISLGDSRTFGWGVTEAESYSGHLQQKLQEYVGPAKRVEVINAGVNAWSYPQMLIYFRERALQYKPDVVIIGDANFWTQFSDKNSPEFVKKFMRSVRLKNLLRRFAIYHYVVEIKLKDFYARHRSKFVPIDPKQDALFKEQQQKDPDAVFRNAIDDLCKVALTNGVKPVLLYLPTLDALNATNEAPMIKVKREIAQRLNLPLVDVSEQIRPGGKSLYLEADPVHYNAPGNDLITGQLFQTITNLVQR
jgi:lysophospholipase L1-like esterase